MTGTHERLLAIHRPWTARRTPGGPALADGPDPRWSVRAPEQSESWLPRLAVERAGDAVRLDPGPHALAPLWWLSEDGVIVAAAERVDDLLELAPAEPDPLGVFQACVYGFRLGRRSVFRGVERARPGDVLVLGPEGGRVETRERVAPGDFQECEQRVVESLAPLVAERFAAGDAVELTGGVDSRLNLALGLAGGEKPRLAFTIGPAEAPDVLCARHLCEHLGVRHERVELPGPSDRLVEDTRAFVGRSDYCSSAASYGWMPAAFREMDRFRDGQLTGAGGEIAGGFFRSRLDPVGEKLGLRRLWTRLRMIDSAARPFWRRGAFGEFRRQTERELLEILGGAGRSWDNRLDALYREHRMRQWGVPVLRASSCWYRVSAPLLTDLYIDWCLAGAAEGAASGRDRQKALIRRLAPDLADMPWVNYFDGSPPKNSLAASLRRVLRGRWLDLGSSETVQRQVRDPWIAGALEDLGGALPLDAGALRDATAQPQPPERPIGHLVTAAIALRAGRGERFG